MQLIIYWPVHFCKTNKDKKSSTLISIIYYICIRIMRAYGTNLTKAFSWANDPLYKKNAYSGFILNPPTCKKDVFGYLLLYI